MLHVEEHTPWLARSSTIASLANRPFMPPMGHRYLGSGDGGTAVQGGGLAWVAGRQEQHTGAGRHPPACISHNGTATADAVPLLRHADCS